MPGGTQPHGGNTIQSINDVFRKSVSHKSPFKEMFLDKKGSAN